MPIAPALRPAADPIPSVWALCAAAALALTLAGCGSTPKANAPAPGRDGPATEVPADLARVPDAEPKVEPIRAGGPNKPYEVLGQSYTPETRDVPLREKGIASWYGRKFHGRKTASGEIYNMHAMTAAHKTMPLPSYARVRNPANGREVVVRINDRGPFVAGRIIDLSYTAALKLDLLRGIGRVEVERLTFDEIRSGTWRRGAPEPAAIPEAVAASPGAPLSTAAAPIAAPSPQPPLPRDEGGPAPGVAAEVGEADRLAAPFNPSRASPPLPAADATEPRVPTARALTSGARGYWVQLGAFRERGGAEDFHQRVATELDWLAPLIAVFSDAPLWRLQAGPYPSRDEAQAAAQRVREALQLVPVIVEKR